MTNVELQDLLTRELHLVDAHFQLSRSGTRINGSIVSPTFKGMTDSERQRAIWDALEKRIGPESTHRVGMLLAYTPDERDVVLEGQTNGHGKQKNGIKH